MQLLKTPTLSLGMHGNWKGLLNLGPKGLGLVGKRKADNKGVQYNLTEEFTAIYRMHPMLPDSLPIQEEAPVPMRALLGEKGAPCFSRSLCTQPLTAGPSPGSHSADCCCFVLEYSQPIRTTGHLSSNVQWVG